MDRSGGVSNGYYGDNSGGSGGGDSPQQPKDDFEDYMWMANEEEAEKEVGTDRMFHDLKYLVKWSSQ